MFDVPQAARRRRLRNPMQRGHRFRSIADTIPTRRFGEPEEVGGTAVYLMSNASSYHTDDSIFIDGGWTVA